MEQGSAKSTGCTHTNSAADLVWRCFNASIAPVRADAFVKQCCLTRQAVPPGSGRPRRRVLLDRPCPARPPRGALYLDRSLASARWPVRGGAGTQDNLGGIEAKARGRPDVLEWLRCRHELDLLCWVEFVVEDASVLELVEVDTAVSVLGSRSAGRSCGRRPNEVRLDRGAGPRRTPAARFSRR